MQRNIIFCYFTFKLWSYGDTAQEHLAKMRTMGEQKKKNKNDYRGVLGPKLHFVHPPIEQKK